jgi:hypothetical protein
MKRNTILTLVIGLVISIAAIGLWRAGAYTTVGHGYDVFNTPDNAVTGETLPAFNEGFFVNAAGAKSKFVPSATITFKGGAAVPGFYGDTVIERVSDVNVPGSTDLKMIGLRLVSTKKLHVDFADGTSADYDISVKESSVNASTGSMYFNSDNTFSSSLQINREYTFTSAGQPNKVAESVALGLDPIGLSATGTWQPSGHGPTGNAAIPVNGGVIIVPNTEQARWAAHGIFPAPPPSPSPTPTRTTPKPIIVDQPVQDQTPAQ